jgi:hypothetical protein
VGSIGWSSSNGGLAAADSSIEEDRDRNMVVTTTIRAATAIIIRIMAAPLFGRDCVWRVTAFVELIGWSLVGGASAELVVGYNTNDDADLALNAIKLERRATEAIKLGLPDLPEVEKPAE